MAAIEPGPGQPSVYFVDPTDGAVIPSLYTVRFGVENFVIEPVGDGMVHAGAGHHHLGIDTECLPAGVVIPQADPWIHFGDGSSEIEVQLTPGRHALVLQPGDGEHRTLENLCATIEVQVEEAAGG